ncbi:hypothetical protein N2152v2_008697 [Parachlorella kessleri]
MSVVQEPDTPGAYLRYHQFKPIGKGAYGIVASATDVRNNQKVAIKKIGNIFDNPLDARRTLREIQILRHLRGHSNIIGLLDVFPPPVGHTYRDVYMVYELMDTDLHQIIRSPQPLSDEHIQFFIYQLLRAVKYMHTAGVVHRDLKPSNLLCNGNCDLKVCDFGLARGGIDNNELMTEYVVTRWYRAPELLLSCSDYGPSIDMWSVGCILAELLGRKPLFPGKDYIHQLNLICKVIGTPSQEDIMAVASEKARHYLQSMPYMPRADVRQYFPGANPAAIDLLERLLVFNPSRRLTCEQALAHPYMASLHDPSDEPAAPALFVPSGHGVQGELTPQQVRAGIYQEMVAFNPDMQFLR